MDLAGFWETDRSAAGFWRWLRSLRNTEDILFRWDDPKPAISYTFESLKRNFGRLRQPVPAAARKPAAPPSPALEEQRPVLSPAVALPLPTDLTAHGSTPVNPHA